MADLHNPLFEDEKEFLERQKLEYERALLGDVEDIKEQTQRIGKYALIGAGVAGGIWLLARAFRSRSSEEEDFEDNEHLDYHPGKALHDRHRSPAYSHVDTAESDDLGFGAGPHQYDRGTQAPSRHERADLAPDVYHTDTEDPFPPLDSPISQYTRSARSMAPAVRPRPSAADGSSASSIMADAFNVFLKSDTGKMLIAQVSAVLMAYVAKKVGEYLPVDKNNDLATAPAAQPATQDIDFTYHHDDANAPQQSL
ncbi:hypothetical protein PK28_02120 [Hymenobacter sp. DG25B]|jgi:hypothetical protein|uniref:hypothetical protein n=1 Tax=Hymenobacter sp. DG25B TaxID=1385664 RepID=UPI0005412CF8|nr:hypothetical protein [Hymenobacter sp. DG25B]AIZ62778.1 hypothetical protein PK28_02120 [Hymenobacter sp. DG25B]